MNNIISGILAFIIAIVIFVLFQSAAKSDFCWKLNPNKRGRRHIINKGGWFCTLYGVTLEIILSICSIFVIIGLMCLFMPDKYGSCLDLKSWKVDYI